MLATDAERTATTDSDMSKPLNWRSWLDSRQFVAVDGRHDGEIEILEPLPMEEMGRPVKVGVGADV